MHFELKSLTEAGIDKSLAKAVHYRLLNEPMHAESICLDILTLDPDNQQAIDILLLSLTDQFDKRMTERYRQALSLRERIQDPYRRIYYYGLICERRALALYRRGGPRVASITYDWLVKAMEYYEEAETLSADDDDDAILRWNTCARIIMSHPDIRPEHTDENMVHFLDV